MSLLLPNVQYFNRFTELLFYMAVYTVEGEEEGERRVEVMA